MELFDGFLFNLVKKSVTPNSDKTLMWISLSIFLFYLFSDPLIISVLGFDILHSQITYLFWFSFDLVCLIIILLISWKLNLSQLPAKLYITIGLTVNMLLFLGMHIDINYFYHYEHWWFWGLYSVTVNMMDVMMVVALLCNKDFLGLVRGYQFLTRSNRNSDLA
ncbi:hypothetical protein [Pseudoalteromonas sp. ZZD1]|uniref:hypothetical protein n=1 Tax=Pseudoalteromonas sp. ZZD1 TaxID=3139395 RepID=UPI003BAC8512